MCYEISSDINERIIVVLTGAIGVREATSVRQQLFPRLHNRMTGIAFQLEAVTEMDSSALGLLLAVQKIAEDFNVKVTILNAHEQLRERLIMAGIAL
ncbi:STAS domain-containing protein [Cohnella herbarum]|uniref:STAS domain-containing protein n=1 Tax=Cohnella herbarum TaxID=2728023 RepID=A0A7Z2ZNH2_9BACL|nr:STAS domain-containing protein [Cohnella herbarum]QJD86104.1 STAS domain-containing protein [Cohnella herbarum]